MSHKRTSAGRTASKTTRIADGPRIPPPAHLEVHTIRVGTDDYVVLAISLHPPEGSTAGIHELDRLTHAERSIVSSVLRGEPNAAIASARGTAPRTISNQLTSIYKKLGVRSRRELRARVSGTSARI